MEELLKAIQSEDTGRTLRRRNTTASRTRRNRMLDKQPNGRPAMSCLDSSSVGVVISNSENEKKLLMNTDKEHLILDMTGKTLGSEVQEEQDVITWCHECNAKSIGECFIHGKVIAVTDNKLPSRARLSLPSILVLKKIKESIPEKYGVFSKRIIKPRTQFGPLEAPVLLGGADLPPEVFDIRIIRQGRQERLDLSQEEACNWMMFVRPATVSQEANLGAYQLHDQIYYISTKTISQMSELRVWYIPTYGQLFGKEPLMSSVPLHHRPSNETEASSPEHEPDGHTTRAAATLSTEKLVCGFCNTLFRSLSQLVAHTCNTLDDTHCPDVSSRPARRKGLPRKMGSISKKDRSRSQISAQPTLSTLQPDAVQSTLEQNQKIDVAPSQKIMKKRGRPKGSKTRQISDDPARTIKQTDGNRKRKKPRLDCRFCHRSFYSEEQYRIHEAEHTGTKPYICEHPGCNKGFGSKFKYWRHSLVHQKPQNRICTYCNRSFNRVDHLKNHVMTHNSKRKLWTCEKCGKQYLYHSTYLFHIALHKARESPTLSCSLCNTEYPTREELINHVKSHNRYKPDPGKPKSHQCPECQKLFTTKKDVRRHMVTHTKDRSFLCEFCPQTFARKDHLRRHYKSNHKKEVLEQAHLDFRCTVCLSVFKSEEYLQYHTENTHSSSSDVIVNPKKNDRQVAQQRVIQNVQSSTQVMLVPVQKFNDTSQEQVQQHVLPQHSLSRNLLQPQHLQSHQQPQPIHIHISQQQQQQQKLTLQSASFPSNLAAGMSGGQAIEVLGEGDHYNSQAPQMLMLKTVPYRFSPRLPQPAPATIAAALTHNLRQIPDSYSQLHQHQQQQQPQQSQTQVSAQHQAYVSTDNLSAVSHPTIVSMLAVSTTDGLLDSSIKGQTVYSQDGTGHLKPLPAQWVLTGSIPSPLTEVSAAHADMSDHCYATATSGAVSANTEAGLKLTALPAGSKIMGHMPHTLEQDTLRFFQSYSTGTETGATVQSVSQSNGTVASSGLQTTWDTISDLVTIPLADCDIMPPITVPQPSIINLPIAVNVQVGDGTVCASSSALSHQT